MLSQRAGMDAVVSLGGSIVARAVENRNVQAYVDAFGTLADQAETLIIVTGAGDLKRYIDAVDGQGVPEARKDMIGVAATRLHATMLAAALDANVAIPRDLESVAELTRTHDVVVLGGLLAGQSTDAVAAECAELIEADRLVLATTVDGVYDEDPAENPGATRFDRLDYGELLDLVVHGTSAAGSYALMDVTAAKLVQRSHLETVVLDGRDPAVLARALGSDHGGTVISD